MKINDVDRTECRKNPLGKITPKGIAVIQQIVNSLVLPRSALCRCVPSGTHRAQHLLEELVLMKMMDSKSESRN